MTVLEGVLLITAGALILGWARSAWISDDRKFSLQEAQDDRDVAVTALADSRAATRQHELDLRRLGEERDTAVRKVSRLLGGDPDATVRLPHWHQFLNPQAAHDRAVTDLMEQQFQDGGTSRD
jgi:hypothetical protein